MNRRIAWLVFSVSLVGTALMLAQAKTPPKPIYTPDAEYTLAARRDRVQGIAVVRLRLDTDGVPHDVKVIRSLRSDLDEKAVEAVSKWRFDPATQDGKPIAVSINVEVNFRLYSK